MGKGNGEGRKTLSSSRDFAEEISGWKRGLKDSFDTGWWRRIVKDPTDKSDLNDLPLGLKIFGVLCFLGAFYALGNTVFGLVDAVKYVKSGGLDAYGVSTIVTLFVFLVDQVLIAAAFVVFGVNIFRNKRRLAALVIYVVHALLIVGALCSLMLYGVTARLIVFLVSFAILIAFQTYLDPGLRQERQLQRKLREQEVCEEQEAGTLGRDLTGKGYIDLNFFNLFWIFVVVSILGDGLETLYHYFVVVPGEWQDRAGLLFGPFSPIYGVGAVLMTLFLNRLYNRNVAVVFVMAAIIGGAFEVFVSYFMQYAFGAVAWDYTGQFLSIAGGRTCGWAMSMWGLLGVVWIKLLLPLLLRVVNMIPWNWRYAVTVVAVVLMLIDCVMTLQSLDCWYERLSRDPVSTPITRFYDKHFDNQYMANRFQSMTINPGDAVRGS
jgi:uncharacterized membrane protein